jgi:hypothetical protein
MHRLRYVTRFRQMQLYQRSRICEICEINANLYENKEFRITKTYNFFIKESLKQINSLWIDFTRKMVYFSIFAT